MNALTATESDIRTERANAYLDGANMGMSHLLDALACGKDVETAFAFAKAMIADAAQSIETGAQSRAERRERRAAIRTQWGVEAGDAILHRMANQKLV